MSIIARFFAANRRVCGAIEKWLPTEFKLHLRTLHRRQVAELVNARPGCVVLDVGAGRESTFLPLIADKAEHLILGMDVSEAELQHNRQGLARMVADAAAARLPLRDGSVDVIASHSVVEHLPDNARFFANCAQVLRSGGVLVHTFPCKYAPFALLNKLLPNWLARRLLASFHPDWRQEAVGFLAYYDHCTFSQIETLLRRSGLQWKAHVFHYYQSIYFDFFVPLYLMMLLYDLIMWRLKIRNLACGMMMVAEKKSS